MLEDRVAELDAERKRYLDLLLGGAVPDRRTEIAKAERSEPEETTPVSIEQGTPVAYTTPLDRVQARFRLAHKNGRIPAQYKARTN